MALDWVIEHKAAFDFLGHPSCPYVTDPEYRAIELICEQVKKAGPKAAIVNLGTLAMRAKSRRGPPAPAKGLWLPVVRISKEPRIP